MAEITGAAKLVGKTITLFCRHQFIDEPSNPWVARWDPRHTGGGEQHLKGLQKLHEVPYSKNMVLREDP
jgi:hypothetical protein